MRLRINQILAETKAPSNKDFIKWEPYPLNPVLCYAFIGNIRVERLQTDKGFLYCIGRMKDEPIKFGSEYRLLSYLTI